MNLVNAALQYNQLFGFNILPLQNKVPSAGSWQEWQQKNMSVDDICAFNWQNNNGIGSLSGINHLRCLDFDHAVDVSVVKDFLRGLGLPSEYKWTVVSGSGKGYHIWFYCYDDSELFKILGGDKSYYKLLLRSGSRCDHIELRWKNCQTALPPSLHPSGNKYKFLFYKHDVPDSPPSRIPCGRLISTLTTYCKLNGTDSPAIEEPKKKETSTVVCHSSLKAASEFLAGKISNYDDWMRLGFALASIGEEGREYFINISINNPQYNDTEDALNKKFEGFLKDCRGEITIGTFYEIAKKFGYEAEHNHFWNIENGKVSILSDLLIEYLEAEGFAKMIINKDYIFIRVKDNIISEISKINIKDHLLEYINNNSEGVERALLRRHFIRNSNILSGDSTLECLHTIKPEIISGSKDKEYFFFKNCFIEVTKDGIRQHDYKELQGNIWEKQKAEHDFSFKNEKSDFEVFINNVCRKDQERINALRSAIGYLLVSYKDPSSAKAIIFIDEKLSDNAFGRSGKGLVSKAISRMKNSLKIDGKNFTFERSFMFQAVDQETQLIIFDDVKKKFSFEKLFSILTEGITIEKKNKNEYRVPYERSPKILITTNHTVEGTDDSSVDRQFVVEFSDYYNAQYKPKDEFGHLFFDEWNDHQWTAFYNYMVECCKYYFQNGLKSYAYVNLTRKKLIDSTAPEFEEFINDLPVNTEYNRKELLESFKKEYEDFGQIKQNTFSKWTKIYADLYNFSLLERRSSGKSYITFIPKLKNGS